MDILEEDSLVFIKALKNKEVSYILVGGLAVIYYGYGRTTGDMDIWLEDTLENRKKFVAALTEYGILGAEIFETLPLIAGYSEIMLDGGIYVDVMSKLTQFSQTDFRKCYESANEWEAEPGISIKVLHINQLIEEKEGNNRLKDRDDVEQLKMIWKLK